MFVIDTGIEYHILRVLVRVVLTGGGGLSSHHASTEKEAVFLGKTT
jgi:hypothetical protein